MKLTFEFQGLVQRVAYLPMHSTHASACLDVEQAFRDMGRARWSLRGVKCKRLERVVECYPSAIARSVPRCRPVERSQDLEAIPQSLENPCSITVVRARGPVPTRLDHCNNAM